MKIALISFLVAPPIGALAIMLPIGLVLAISGSGHEALSVMLLSIPLSYLFGGAQAFIFGFLFCVFSPKMHRWQMYPLLAFLSTAITLICIVLAESNAYFLAFPSTISALLTTRILFTNKIQQLMRKV
ncbi:hypothetical protein [Azotobacter salinestris]|uniref:hypothetical protein n=1 Tax=Azotobacter salinestris TaxID=69964 RepID=UPI0032DF055D